MNDPSDDVPLLLTPGPTPVPDEVLRVLARPVRHHRTEASRQANRRLVERLQEVCRTSNPVAVITGSGTAAMESALVGIASSEDRVLVIDSGKFGHRWVELCESFSLQHEVLAVRRGSAVKVDQVRRLLEDDPALSVVCGTLVETSTAVVHDIEALGRLVDEMGRTLIVDGIAGVGCQRLECDAWRVDALCISSQKALMMIPGLSYLALSPRARQKIKDNPRRGYYLDPAAYLNALETDDTPYTASQNMVDAQLAALDLLLADGIEAVWQRSETLGRAVRKAIEAMGLEVFATSPCDGLTAVTVPEGIDGVALLKQIDRRHGVRFAGGQSELKGRILRIGHMGSVGRAEVARGLRALGAALAEAGRPVDTDAGLSALDEILKHDGA